ncbi:MAG: CusA/CzcA family heavy metal efflux RND transporter, partial [Steroidobacteraceae bacterium]|nr:CusA/CzcA family heavy metal efflux RND transporter [Steroidobacteraceae bacterium]MDW8258584.1 CusA/CzcA family heavy metal efflux RND transporter [Gammaproteobacteria bacterium]
ALSVVPAALATFVRGRVAEHDTRLVERLRRAYRPLLGAALARPAAVIGGAAALTLFGIWGATRLGTEFVPALDEGDLAAQILRIAGTGLQQSIAMQAEVDRAVMRLPEVANVFTRLGTSDVATDPMPPGIGDMYIMLKPRAEWPQPRKPTAALERELAQVLASIPGHAFEISQPIRLRVNELLSGVREDVAVKVYGDDLQELARLGARIAPLFAGVRGASGAKVEAIDGLPTLSIVPDRDALARYGLSQDTVQQVVATAIAGTAAGQIYEGDRRFDIVLRLPEHLRGDLAALAAIPIPLPGEHDAQAFVPLAAVATLELSEGPNQISRENGKRRLAVSGNVRDRDLGGFVAELRAVLDRELELPSGYWLGFGGTFEQLESARARLAIVVPAVLLIIFLLLCSAFGTVRDALIVFSGVPLALVGGVAALALRGMPLSITAAVGFIALSGIAVLNGLVMVACIRSLLAQGATLTAAVYDGALQRLRPVLMTALVASLGFVPMAFNVGPGSEVQRPLATVVIGGVLSSTALTLLVLPALYRRFGRATVTAARAPEIPSAAPIAPGSAPD